MRTDYRNDVTMDPSGFVLLAAAEGLFLREPEAVPDK